MKRCLLTFALLCCVSAAWAVALPIEPLWSGILDNSGQPAAGGTVYFYRSGTSTPKQVWDETTKVTARTFVVLDGNGRAKVYGDMADNCRYRITAYASDSSLLFQVDGVEIVSTISPTTLSPKYLTSVVSAEIASLTVSQRANLASATLNGAHISNATCSALDIYNSYAETFRLKTGTLESALDANSYLINNVATPSAKMDAARKYETDALTSNVASLPTTLFGPLPYSLIGFGWLSNLSIDTTTGVFATAWTAITGTDTYQLVQAKSLTNTNGYYMQTAWTHRIYVRSADVKDLCWAAAKLTVLSASGTETIVDQVVGNAGCAIGVSTSTTILTYGKGTVTLNLHGVYAPTISPGEAVTVRLWLKTWNAGEYYLPETAPQGYVLKAYQ